MGMLLKYLQSFLSPISELQDIFFLLWARVYVWINMWSFINEPLQCSLRRSGGCVPSLHTLTLLNSTPYRSSCYEFIVVFIFRMIHRLMADTLFLALHLFLILVIYLNQLGVNYFCYNFYLNDKIWKIIIFILKTKITWTRLQIRLQPIILQIFCLPFIYRSLKFSQTIIFYILNTNSFQSESTLNVQGQTIYSKRRMNIISI